MKHRHRLVLVALGGARRRAAFAEDSRNQAVARARAARELLIVAAMPAVVRNASQICMGLPANVTKQDLVDAGYLALVEKAAKFDPARGVTLWQYARLGVRGAMWDQVRRRNWVEMSHLELKVEFIGIEDERQTPPAMLDAARKSARVAEAMECLDARERQVVRRYYDGEELVAMGRELGLCKQTMTTIHRGALAKMQDYFRIRGIKAA